MKAIRVSCVAVVVGIVVGMGVAAATASGAHLGSDSAPAASYLTPQALQALGDRWTAIAAGYRSDSNLTPAALNALEQRWQAIGAAYLRENQQQPVGVQWHDVFTGVGATLAVLALLAAGVAGTRRSTHVHRGRFTLAH